MGIRLNEVANSYTLRMKMYFMVYTTAYYWFFYAVLFRKRNIIRFVLCGFEKGKSSPITGLDRARGFQEVEAPRCHDSRHRIVVRLSALRTSRLYPPGSTPGTHFCYRLSQPQGHSAIGRIMSMKNSNDNIGNRTRDLQDLVQCLNQVRHRMVTITYHAV